MYDVSHHFPHAQCFQFILEDIFFPLFPLDPWLCAPQTRALEMWRGVVKGSHMGSCRETRLEYEIPRNRGRKSRENAKEQVGVQ